jgi:hypothetical protein
MLAAARRKRGRRLPRRGAFRRARASRGRALCGALRAFRPFCRFFSIGDARASCGSASVADRIVAGCIAGELLVVFDVAMRERCMHRCAVRLGLTELDLRSALRKLDATLGEPVFTIVGSGITPTLRAEQLARTLCDDLPRR